MSFTRAADPTPHGKGLRHGKTTAPKAGTASFRSRFAIKALLAMTQISTLCAAADARVSPVVTLSSEPENGPGTCTRLGYGGTYEAGGVAGDFKQTVELKRGNYRTDVRTGELSEETGFDGAPWIRHDGILVAIDMIGPLREARSRAFLARFGWRDRQMRRFLRQSGRRTIDGVQAVGVVAKLPDADEVTLWFDRKSHRMAEAVISADGGPLLIRYSDWRSTCGTSVAFRREETDPTGQRTSFVARVADGVDRGDWSIVRPPAREFGSIAPDDLSVPFILDHGNRGHIVVAASIDGHPVNLVFDTGAANYLTPEAAKGLGLKVSGGVNIGGVGASSYAGGYGIIGNLTVGGATLTNTAAMIAPLPTAATNPRPGLTIQGLIGFEILTQFRTLIDYGNRTIQFADATGQLSDRTLPFRTDGNSIFVEASVNGVRGWFRIDSGDGGSVTLFQDFARSLRYKTVRMREVAPGEIGGDLSYQDLTLDRFSIGGTVLRRLNAQISFQQAGSFASRSIAGNIGAGVLSRFRLLIDYKTHRLAFWPSAIPASAK